MKTLAIGALAAVGFCCLTAAAESADPGWPRVFKQDNRQLTVYQPQIDYWHGYTNVHFRCAIAVKGVLKQEKFGVAEIDAVTLADQVDRIVAMVPTQRDIRFPNCTDAELGALRRAVDDLRPPGQATTISLDRVLAFLNPADQPTQLAVDVNLNPPRIFYSRQPAILVILMGEPQLKPVETNRTDLMFVFNTNWDLFYDTASRLYYLLNQDNWLTAPDMKGPWTPAQTLPASLSKLPANGNWAEARKNIPGKRVRSAPTVFVSTEPAELITTEGDPSFELIKGTGLMRVVDTDSTLFFNTPETAYYFLVAGRWFRARSLDGPWSAASRDLPEDFSQIPDSDPAAFVKASVPGTREAQDAVQLASIPTTSTVNMTNTVVHVVYNGVPQFELIQTTVIQAAVNSPQQVFLVNGNYYCCDAGIWFVSAAAAGPWSFCTVVPSAIYTIPVSSPYYNVTYVRVQSYTPTTVVYSQTAGYSGEYVAATGVVMFGAGMAVGAAIASSHYYCPPYPCFYSYGCCATYHYGYGGYYYGGGVRYGPYGGAGYTTAYNPATGTYSRSATAYGPYGSATVKTAYNPYTGSYARSAQVNTAYGSAGRAAGYNPSTGTYGASGYRSTANGTAAASRAYNPYTGARAGSESVSTAYGSASRSAAYNPTTGQGATAATRSGQYGSAGTMKTTSGGSATAWNTASGQGAVGKSSSGDVYAAKDGTVYRKEPGGGWSENSGSGWQNVSKPQSTTTSSYQQQAQSKASSYQQQHPSSSGSSSSSWSQNRQSMESQAQSRSWGNQQHASAQSWQSSAQSHNWGGSSGGRSYGGGGGGRR